jgi:acyl dehydratase
MTALVPGRRSYEQIAVGDELAPVDFALSLYRLVVAAGSNRDFNSIHHNREYARSTGAPDAYASTFFLLGAWERVVRDFIGAAGTIRAVRGFRMRRFNLAGSTMTVGGRVVDRRIDDDRAVLVIEVVSVVDGEVTVGPGQVEVTVPRAGAS